MVKTASTMLPLGSRAPQFSLPNVDGKMVSLSDFEDAPALLVVFMCNHCPFVVHIQGELAKFASEYQQQGVAIVGISSNNVAGYPQDGPEQMKTEAKKHGYTFAYLYDESQSVAQEYHAACTPDFFLFDKDRRLVYRGQFDESRPGSGIPVTGSDLRQACDALLAGQPVSGRSTRASAATSNGSRAMSRVTSWGKRPGTFLCDIRPTAHSSGSLAVGNSSSGSRSTMRLSQWPQMT